MSETKEPYVSGAPAVPKSAELARDIRQSMAESLLSTFSIHEGDAGFRPGDLTTGACNAVHSWLMNDADACIRRILAPIVDAETRFGIVEAISAMREGKFTRPVGWDPGQPGAYVFIHNSYPRFLFWSILTWEGSSEFIPSLDQMVGEWEVVTDE